MSELENEFTVIATFNNWLKILPELKKNGYKRISFIDKQGYSFTYFKKES